MPGTSLVVVDHMLRAAQAVHRGRPRMGIYILMGLAASGWMGFLVLVGLVLAGRPAGAPAAEARPEATKSEAAWKLATSVQVEPEHAPPPVLAALAYELGAYEERRRVQERMRHADVADHDDGNVSASRSFYEYAARRGWAQAALALAFTYDPHELQRRGVTIAADSAKARACYIQARELMNATVAFYLSRLPPGAEEKC
jgi:TPR repeat protein